MKGVWEEDSLNPKEEVTLTTQWTAAGVDYNKEFQWKAAELAEILKRDTSSRWAHVMLLKPGEYFLTS